MTRTCTIAVVVAAALVGRATPASADGIYFFEQLGGADVHDELGATFEGARFHARAGLGLRRRAWALEGWIGAYDSGAPYDGGERIRSDLFTYGLDLKYHARLTRHLELYVRGGLSRGELRQYEGVSYAGRGAGVGAGIQVRGKVSVLGFLFWPLFFSGVGPKISAALYLDNGVEFYRLHRDGDFDSGSSIDARLTSTTLGFRLGYGF